VDSINEIIERIDDFSPPINISSSSIPSSSSSMKEDDSFTDSRDGKTYKTVIIGSQIWMAENLNFMISSSSNKCYGDDNANCNKYGRLYSWAAAMSLPADCNGSSCANNISEKHRGICPEGWHIPNDAEWDILITEVGGEEEETAGTKLKATNGWDPIYGAGNGTDIYGFAALPGGYGEPFDGVGKYGYWWSANLHDGYKIHCKFMRYDNGYAGWYINCQDNNLSSVRCLKD